VLKLIDTSALELVYTEILSVIEKMMFKQKQNIILEEMQLIATVV
jgi:hypothetical protein